MTAEPGECEASNSPAPPSPRDADLRDFPRASFDVREIISGELGRLPDLAFRPAVVLRAAAWHELPAGSLPVEDAALAVLAGFGRDARGAKAWAKAKAAGALAGWFPCSDGRLYHAALAGAVATAWATKLKAREKRAADADRLRRWRDRQQGEPGEADVKRVSGDEAADDEAPPKRVSSQRRNADETPMKRLGEREGEREEKVRTSSLRSDGAPAAPPPPDGPPDARKTLFGEGLARLRRLTGRAEAPARAMLGRWLRPLGDDCARLSAILAEAESLRPADPVAWIEAAVGNRAGAPAPNGRQPRRSALAEAMSRLGLADEDPHAGPVIEGEAERVW